MFRVILQDWTLCVYVLSLLNTSCDLLLAVDSAKCLLPRTVDSPKCFLPHLMDSPAGLSGAGKTTIAFALEDYLVSQGLSKNVMFFRI